MKPGRRPAPTAVKLAKGVHPSRINRAEAIPPVEGPTCPRALSAAARKVWRRLGPSLEAKGVLTVWDVDAFAIYCEAVARHRRLVEALEERDAEGKHVQALVVPTARNGWTKSPLLTAIKEAEQTVRSYAAEFGLTPSSRAQVKIIEPTDGELDALLHPVRVR